MEIVVCYVEVVVKKEKFKKLVKKCLDSYDVIVVEGEVIIFVLFFLECCDIEDIIGCGFLDEFYLF